jgi:hypothetical protein
LLGGDEQTVNPAPDEQREFIRLHSVFKGQFGQIPRWAGPLDFLMAANSSEGPVRTDKLPRAAKITLPQDKLDQVPH